MFRIDMRMCDEITRIYERQADESLRAVMRFYDDITEIARRTTFEPMVKFGNRIRVFYDTELKAHLMREFRNWYDGGYSFHALMDKIRAGSDACAEARMKMDNMERDLQTLFRAPSDQLSLDTSSPRIEASDYEDLRQALTVCVRAFGNAQNDAESSVRSMGSDNDVVLLIGDIVKTTGRSLEESFNMMIREVTAGEDFTDSMRGAVMGAITGTAKTMGSSIRIPMII